MNAPRPAPELEIRAPLGGRLAQGGIFAVGGFVAIIGTIALIGRGSVWAVLAAVALAVWVAYFYRLIGLSVKADREVLEVRNLFVTRRINRGAVRSVTLGPSNVAKSPNQTVVIELVDGRSLPLDACARTLQSKRKVRRVEEFRRRLAGWSEIKEASGEVDLAEAS
ncbi:MAG: PH domain-containing protein [Acidimicrobiales bacterium]